MLDTLKSRIYQGQQFIKDIPNAPMREQFRGFPILKNIEGADLQKCVDACPTGALKLNPLSIDMGKCTFCGACKNADKSGNNSFFAEAAVHYGHKNIQQHTYGNI